MLKKIYSIIAIALYSFSVLNAIDTTSEDVAKIIKTYRKSLPSITKKMPENITPEQCIIRFLKRFHPTPNTLEGDEVLALNISSILAQGNGLTFLLPANPCKSRNTERKVLGLNPDLGEVLEIITLKYICDSIAELCHQPVKCVLVSDGVAFGDILRISEDEVHDYVRKVRHLIRAQDADNVVTLMMLGDFPWHSVF